MEAECVGCGTKENLIMTPLVGTGVPAPFCPACKERLHNIRWQSYERQANKISINDNVVLTEGMIDILRLREKGKTDKQISEILRLSMSTISGRLQKCFILLGVNKIKDAIKVAREQGYEI